MDQTCEKSPSDSEPVLKTNNFKEFNSVKPITPDEVYPFNPLPEVFEVFNYLIKRNFDGISSVIRFTDVTLLVCSKLNLPLSKVCEKRLLEVESYYREVGWEVEFDCYVGTFVFSRKKTNDHATPNELLASRRRMVFGVRRKSS